MKQRTASEDLAKVLLMRIAAMYFVKMFFSTLTRRLAKKYS